MKIQEIHKVLLKKKDLNLVVDAVSSLELPIDIKVLAVGKPASIIE